MTYEILQEPTWGDAELGGDSRGVAEQFSSGVQTVVANSVAFAALKVDGSVVTWGRDGCGGDESPRGVVTKARALPPGLDPAASNFYVYEMWRWSPDSDSRGVAKPEQLSSGVQTVVGNHVAFAAVKLDGSVVTWGEDRRNGTWPFSSTQ